MPRKIIIETEEDIKEMAEEEFREPFRRMRDHMPFGPERIIKKRMHPPMDNEVKLFTDKAEMVSFVNQLKDIHNVEIFKIEDQLYKVLVTRRRKHEDCNGSHEGHHHHQGE